MSTQTLRLNMPQWQGGAEPAYRFGAELLRWLAPAHVGPEETVAVPVADGRPLAVERGIRARTALLSQARAARAAIERQTLQPGTHQAVFVAGFGAQVLQAGTESFDAHGASMLAPTRSAVSASRRAPAAHQTRRQDRSCPASTRLQPVPP